MSLIPPSSVSLANLVSTSQGSEVFNDTAPHSGPFSALVFITDTVFSQLEGNLSGWEGFSFPAGTVLTGEWSSLRLLSGSIVAYRGFD